MEGKIRNIDIRQPFQVTACEKCGDKIVVRSNSVSDHKCSK